MAWEAALDIWAQRLGRVLRWERAHHEQIVFIATSITGYNVTQYNTTSQLGGESLFYGDSDAAVFRFGLLPEVGRDSYILSFIV